MTDLSNEARHARQDLATHPYNDTAAALAAATVIEQADEESMAAGLRELEVKGLAVQQGGRYRLTQAGIDWFPS